MTSGPTDAIATMLHLATRSPSGARPCISSPVADSVPVIVQHLASPALQRPHSDATATHTSPHVVPHASEFACLDTFALSHVDPFVREAPPRPRPTAQETRPR